MSEKATALRLADCLEGNATTPWTREEAAAELRRLHTQRDELLAALKDARRKLAWFTESYPQDLVVSEGEFFGPIDAAIAKATGGQA